MKSTYLNTDLEIWLDATTIEASDLLMEICDVIYSGMLDGNWRICVEAPGSGNPNNQTHNPEHDISELIKIYDEIIHIKAINKHRITRRSMIIGWQPAKKQPEGVFSIAPDLLNELAKRSISLEVVIYPANEKDLYPEDVTTEMRRDILNLLNWLCVRWGSCIPQTDTDRIAAAEYLTADDFAREVLLAEGINPDYEIQYYCQIKRRFIEEFGSSSVNIHQYMGKQSSKC